MAVIIEATTVVVVIASLEQRFPGGVSGFAQNLPNSTYHSDGRLAAVSFMVLADVREFVGALSKHGFSDPWRSRSDDVAVVDQSQGFLAPCDWLKVDLRPFTSSDGMTFGLTVAWTVDDDPSRIAVPDGWCPRRAEQVSADELKENYHVVEVRRHDDSGGAVIAYRHRLTGQILYVARTAPAGYGELRKRYLALHEEIGQLLAMPDRPQRTTAAARAYEEATRLVEQSEPALGVFFVQGVAARLAGLWSEAETAFRRITEHWPDNRDAWFELTWALASLGRVAEAETVARRAVEIDGNSAGAHANLASVLLQQGRPDEALPPIERAIALDPSNAISRRIHAQVRNALGSQPAQAQAPVPWYKRWRR
jgi:hypothetical protein